MLVGAAKILADNKAELTGKIRFMFQPGEEGHHGARYMIEEGVCDGVDRAFAIHVLSSVPSGLMLTRRGPLMASADKFEITVHGSGGHASQPHYAVDPIPAAASIVTGLHTMVGRDIDANQPGVLTVGHINAGTTNNVIPEVAYIEGTIRSLNETTRSTLKEGIERVANGIAGAHKCSCTVDIEQGYPVTVNHDGEADRVAEVATSVLGPWLILRDANRDHGGRGLELRPPASPRRNGVSGWLPQGHRRSPRRRTQPLELHAHRRRRHDQRRHPLRGDGHGRGLTRLQAPPTFTDLAPHP